jgi:hypothetical protein
LRAQDTPSLRTTGLTSQGGVVIVSTTHSEATSSGWRIAISYRGRDPTRTNGTVWTRGVEIHWAIGCARWCTHCKPPANPACGGYGHAPGIMPPAMVKVLARAVEWPPSPRSRLACAPSAPCRNGWGHCDARTTMIDTHVSNRGGPVVGHRHRCSPRGRPGTPLRR